MFGSALAGGLLGFLVGKLTRFEIGMTVGMLVFGGVTLWFAWLCYGEYRAFAHAGTKGLWGEVVRIVDKPSNESGTITSPAPIVKVEPPGGGVHFVEGPTAMGVRVGEHVNVIFDAADPARSRIGRIGELRGGAIAFMLFGTFGVSFAVLMAAQAIDDAREKAGARKGARAAAAMRRMPVDGKSARFRTASSKTLAAALFCSIVWIGVGGAPLLERFAQGFAGVAASLTGYALWGAYSVRLGYTWTVGLLMLALNFGLWAFALNLLR